MTEIGRLTDAAQMGMLKKITYEPQVLSLVYRAMKRPNSRWVQMVLVVLLAAALLAVLGHIAWANHEHSPACVVCTWGQVYTLVVSGVSLLLYPLLSRFFLQVRGRSAVRHSFLPPARSPPSLFVPSN